MTQTTTPSKKTRERGAPTSGGHRGKPPGPPQKRWMSPTLGLARPGEKESSPATVQLGGWAGSEKSAEHVMHGDVVTGRTDTTESVAGAGAKVTHKDGSASFDGTTKVEHSQKEELLAGAEAAFKTIVEADERYLALAIEGCARAGVFGEASRRDAISRGPFGASWEGGASTGLGAETKVEGSAVASARGLFPALSAAIEVGVKLGWWGKAEIQGQLDAGPLYVTAMSKISGMLGVEAEVSASCYASVLGVGAEFSAEAFAGAKATGEARVEAGIKQASLELGLEGTAAAGAHAEASGSFSIDLRGVKVEVKASAWAGAKASAKGTAALKVFGKRIVKAEGEISVFAGAGVEFEGAFELSADRIHFRGGIGAALKGGFGGMGDIEIDVRALTEVVVAQLREYHAVGEARSDSSPDYIREPLPDAAAAKAKQQKAYDTYYENFLAYHNRNILKEKGPITRDKVQAIIDEAGPLMRAEFAYLETDAGIKRAALKAFAGQLTYLDVQAGRIVSFELARSADLASGRARKKEDEGMRVARDKLRGELSAYCLKKAEKGDHGVKQGRVLEIIKANLPKLRAVFGEETDEVVTFVAAETLDGYATNVVYGDGKIAWAPVPGGAEKIKQGFAQEKVDAAARAKVAELHTALLAYRTQLLGGKDELDTAKVRSLLAKHVGKLEKTEANHQHVTAALTRALDGLVLSVSYDANGLTLNPSPLGVVQQQGRTAMDAVVLKFRTSLEGYRTKKTKGGEHGLKGSELDKKAVAALKGYAVPTDTTDLDAAMRGAALDALEGVASDIVVVGGRVRGVDLVPGAMERQKDNYARDGSAVLGQDEIAYKRRLVADHLRKPLAALEGRVRARQARNPGDASAELGIGEVNDVLTKALATIAADVRNEVGDEQVKDSLEHRFEDVTGVVVQDLRVTGWKVGRTGIGALTAAKRANDQKSQRVVDAIARELKALDRPQQAVVQAVVNNHVRSLTGLPPEELDALVMRAVFTGLPGLADLDVAGGKVTRLVLGPPTNRTGA